MEISIFDAVGPIMIGPSSSHTAGAAKLGRVAALIVGKPFKKVEFGLHGSFAKTYKGHGTDIALAAGVLLWVATIRKRELNRTWGIVMLLGYVAYFLYLLSIG